MANIQSIITNGNGNVLIGTTTDSGYKLLVNGTTYIASTFVVAGNGNGTAKIGNPGFGGNYTGISLNGNLNTGSYNFLSSTDDNHLYINRPSGNNIYFRVNNSDQMTILSSGNVGIGTESGFNSVSGTETTLHISNSNAASLYLSATGGSGNKYAIYSSSSGALQVFNVTQNNYPLGITSGGNVLIGTTTGTGAKLRVYGGYMTVEGTNTAMYIESNYAGGNGLDAGTLISASGTNSNIIIIPSGGGVAGSKVVGSAYNGSAWRSMLEYANVSSGEPVLSLVKTAGNVGIGTTAPGSKLQVEGANPFIRVNNTSADDHGIKISYNGSDAHGLHLLYNANSAVSYIDNTYQAVSGQVYGNIYIRQNVGGTMTSRITIKADGGNVGIGTTSPSQALDVNGYITSSRYYPYNSNSTYISGDTGGLVIQGSGYLYVPASGGSYFEGAVRFRGYIYNDSATYLTINGGTSNVTYFTGNVGIGTTSPSEKLHVDGNVIVTYNNSFQGINSIGNKAILARVSPTTGIINYAEYATATNLNGFVMGSDDARVKGNIATDSLEFITNTSTRMTILSNGDVGINNTNPSRKLDVTGEARVVSTSNLAMFIKTSSGFGAGISYEDSTTGGNDVVYAGAIGAAFFIATGAAERVRVLSGGNVGIATNNPLSRLHVVGDARIASGSLGVGVAPNATDGRVDASNDIVAYSTSDQRLKENVMPIENALEKVKTLTGVEFDWKEKTAHVHGYHGHDVGIIAQDVQAVLPEAVRTNESGYLSVRYEKMIALLIEANKELAARVEELEKKLK